MYFNPEVATRPTQWCVLHIALSAEQCCEAFKANRILRCTPSPSSQIAGWRYYGEVELGIHCAFEWFQLTVAPIGVLAWADKALARYWVQVNGFCAGCEGSVLQTWMASYRQGAWCAGCWNREFLRLAAEKATKKELPKDGEEDAPMAALPYY